MFTTPLRLLTATLALGAALLSAAPALADPMIYTFQVNASGQLNGQSFTNTPVTVTVNANTADIYPHEDWAVLVPAQSTLIEVAGVGSDSFAQPIAAVSNFVDGFVGFAEPVSDWGILFIGHPAVLTYHLDTPLAPITGPADGNPGVAFDTLGGSFTYDSFDSAGTFTATAAPVPEPATWASLAAGLMGVGWVLRRRRA